MNNEEFTRQAKGLLDDSAESLDGHTRSRLHQARNRALASGRWRSPWLNWSLTGSLAASLAVAVLLLNPSDSTPPLPDIYADPVQQAVAEDLELMDDLDFIAWLVMEEDSNVPDQST